MKSYTGGTDWLDRISWATVLVSLCQTSGKIRFSGKKQIHESERDLNKYVGKLH